MDCSQDNSKTLEGEEQNGHGPLLLSRGIIFNVQAIAVCNAEEKDEPPARRCPPTAENVHLSAFVVMAPYHGSATGAILDTSAGPKLVCESFLRHNWKKFRKRF